jgi:hypothetical protein
MRYKQLTPMDSWIFIVGFFAVYFALQLWILPRLGVRT